MQKNFFLQTKLGSSNTHEAHQNTCESCLSVLTSEFTDIKHADDTVYIMSPHRFLHPLQAYSLKRGMALNQEKCQLLAINSELSVYLIDHLTPANATFVQLNRPFLPKELRIEPTPRRLSGISAHEKLLCNSRHQEALWTSGSHCKVPPCFFSIQPFPVPENFLLTILLFGTKSRMYLQSHLTKLNKLHYKVLRQILNLKSSFYHKVLELSHQVL